MLMAYDFYLLLIVATIAPELQPHIARFEIIQQRANRIVVTIHAHLALLWLASIPLCKATQPLCSMRPGHAFATLWTYVDVTAVLNKNLQVKRCVRRMAISQQSGECKHDMSVATYCQPATLYNEIVECIHRVHRLTNTHHRSNLTQTRQQSHEDYHKMMQT